MADVNNNKRIIKNTGFLYVRMLFLMLIGFFTTRKILEALGVVDLGIYNVVGTLVVIFDFVSSGLSNATQRFLNIGIGENNIAKTKQYFSQSLIIHIILSLVIVLAIETIGLWLVNNKLIIPLDRMDAAITITHLSAITVIFRFIKICYQSDIIAREHMNIFAYISIFEGIAKLLICYAVIYCQIIDKLVLYVLLLLLINAAITICTMVYCTYKFEETKFAFYKDVKVYKQLFSFISINSFGIISWALGKQGINVIMNMFFTPAVIGARGLATQLDSVITQFTTNIDIAIKPQIVKLYAQGKINEMLLLAHSSSRYVFYLAFIISIPLLFQTKEILSIWLDNVPLYTDVFVKLLICEILATVLGSAYDNLSLATGKIVGIQVYGRIITLIGLPISYLMLLYWQNVYVPTVIVVVLSFIYSLYVVFYMERILKFGILNYLKIVFFPLVKVVAITLAGCCIIDNLISINNIYISLLVESLSYCIYGMCIVYLIGTTNGEKKTISRFINTKIKKYKTNNI